MMSVVSQRPRRQYEVLHWGHVDLQEYANGRFVSNKNIFIIVFFNTYYHKQINKILISACNETFRQSSDPVYAHTPMRNVGRLRTFNPKLKDSAGGEVNNKEYSEISGYRTGTQQNKAPTPQLLGHSVTQQGNCTSKVSYKCAGL